MLAFLAILIATVLYVGTLAQMARLVPFVRGWRRLRLALFALLPGYGLLVIVAECRHRLAAERFFSGPFDENIGLSLAIAVFLFFGMQGVAQIVRERAGLERQLREQLAFVEALMDAIPLPAFFRDRQGCYLGCNRAFCEFTGFTREQLAGRTVHELYRQDLADRYQRMDNELLARGGTQTYEGRILHHQHQVERYIRFHKTVFEVGTGGIVGVLEDITEHKRAEEVLRQAHKMEGLGRLAGGISHHFNNLFQAIHSHLEMSLHDTLAPRAMSQVERALAMIGEAAELSKQLLAFSGHVDGRLEAVDFRELLWAAVPGLREGLPEGIVVSLELPGDAAPVRLLSEEWHRVLKALVTNAADAMAPHSGAIQVSLRGAPFDPAVLASGHWA